jgi:Site-specific recombinases, DNA invertase Pin homologs
LRVVIYIRVSTKMQATEDKYSLRAQKTELENYVKRMKWQLVDIKQDVDSGGKFDKKGLDELMDMADTGKMDAVLVLDQSRLSRLDGLHWEMLKAVLKQNNIKLAEPGRMVDLNDDVQEFMSDIQNWFARRGRKDIAKTMMRGKRQMMREGKFWGRVPLEYVYNKETHTARKRPGYEWVIPMIDKLFLHDQAGYVTIANQLNKIKYQANGRPWNETLVYRRLVSKAFHGVAEKTFATGETIRMDDFYPPMRTLETYQAIQEEIHRRHVQYRTYWNPSGQIHMLRRVKMTCGMCGRVIALEQHGKGNYTAFYLKHGRKRKLSDRSVCSISINTKRCDRNIIQAIKDILTSERLAKRYIDLSDDSDKIDALKKEQSVVIKSISKLNERMDRLMDLYLDGSFDKGELDDRKHKIDQERSALASRQNELKVKLDLLEKNQWNYKMIYAYMKLARNFDTDLTPLEQAQMIGNLFPTATVYLDKLVLHGRLPIGTVLDVTVGIDQTHVGIKYGLNG